jgi:hypothetical protein
MINNYMFVYSKYQKLQYAVMAAILIICFAGFIIWTFKENHLVDREKDAIMQKRREVEEFVGNRPWIPEWSELVEKRAGIPIANLSFQKDSIAIPVKLIPYNMKIMDIKSAQYLDGKTYFDPNVTLYPGDWKELISLLPAKIPYDYNRQQKDFKEDRETERESNIQQAKCSAIRKTVSACYDVELKVPEREMPTASTPISKTATQEEHEKVLEDAIRRQQENEAIFQKYGYKELPEFRYDYYRSSKNQMPDLKKYDEIVNKIYYQLLDKFKKYTTGRESCASASDQCTMNRVDWRLIKAGEHIKTKEPILEGQMLLDDNRQVYLLVRFVATASTIYTVYLEGYEYKSTIDIVGNDTISDSRRVFINSHPMLGEYNASNTYLYDSTEWRGALPQLPVAEADQIGRAKAMMQRDQDALRQPTCYGKQAITQSECEAEYKADGSKETKVGVWDTQCTRNEDCPFYQANKNYPNNFGGCIQGSCQMPYGITQTSPQRYQDESRAVCYQCKGKDVNCCGDQKDRIKYPLLRSPDYKFSGDEQLRRQYF